MTIGDKIYELRSSRNMSLREFAEIAGVTHTTIARLESDTFGTQKIYLDTIYQICKNLSYDFSAFLTETGYISDFGARTAAPLSSTPTPMHADLTPEERQIIEEYRKLPETSKDLFRRMAGIKEATKK